MKTLTDEHAQLFKGKNVGTLATIRRDGSAQLTPVWIDWDGEYVLFNTAEPRVKMRNIRRNPVVSVCVVNSEDPYQYVSVTGRAEITEEGAIAHIRELSQRYRGRDFTFRDEARRLTVRVKPDRVLASGF